MTARSRSALAVVLPALLALPSLADGKPLYLTVSRAFGTDEQPVVEVAFERRGPVELRVVKPDALDAFLAKETDLRRAYEPPESRDNPGLYLSRGL
ncbi:MAG TPA: hypothetical protein VMG32_07415, partial [Anaeromyxobacteraceae bacterium]|nr:hypothetical protein [Anaeromyxobacteraceae bacterium]